MKGDLSTTADDVHSGVMVGSSIKQRRTLGHLTALLPFHAREHPVTSPTVLGVTEHTEEHTHKTVQGGNYCEGNCWDCL
jgi:hypothetical protein